MCLKQGVRNRMVCVGLMVLDGMGVTYVVYTVTDEFNTTFEVR